MDSKASTLINHKGVNYTVMISPVPKSCYACPLYTYANSEHQSICTIEYIDDHKNIGNERSPKCPLK